VESYEFRLGGAYSPWSGTLIDVGGETLYRSSAVANTSSFAIYPTVGAEQAVIPQTFWLRAGLDETTWTTGTSIAFSPFKIDLALLFNLAAARTGGIFGYHNVSIIGTINFNYESLLAGNAEPQGH
jgi:hypothetical protein